jgi:hypothetical protein
MEGKRGRERKGGERFLKKSRDKKWNEDKGKDGATFRIEQGEQGKRRGRELKQNHE